VNLSEKETFLFTNGPDWVIAADAADAELVFSDYCARIHREDMRSERGASTWTNRDLPLEVMHDGDESSGMTADFDRWAAGVNVRGYLGSIIARG